MNQLWAGTRCSHLDQVVLRFRDLVLHDTLVTPFVALGTSIDHLPPWSSNVANRWVTAVPE